MLRFSLLKVIKYFLNNSYVKLGIISAICFLIDLSVFLLLILKLNVFVSNLISASIGLILDYIIATRKVFKNSYKEEARILVFIFYIIFSIILVYFSSYLVDVFTQIIGSPFYSKFLVIPISFTLYWLFYKIFFKKK